MIRVLIPGWALLAVMASSCDSDDATRRLSEAEHRDLEAAAAPLQERLGFTLVVPRLLPSGINHLPQGDVRDVIGKQAYLTFWRDGDMETGTVLPAMVLTEQEERGGVDIDCPVEPVYTPEHYQCDELRVMDHPIAAETVPTGENILAYDLHFRIRDLKILLGFEWQLSAVSTLEATNEMKQIAISVVESLILESS